MVLRAKRIARSTVTHDSLRSNDLPLDGTPHGGGCRFSESSRGIAAEMSLRFRRIATQLKIDNALHLCRTLRGAIEARALVSRRIRPLQLNGKSCTKLRCLITSDSRLIQGGAANDLLPFPAERM